MKQLIRISGPASTGKTTCIKLAHQRLIDRFPSATAEILRAGHGVDYCLILEIDGIKIGIETRGDPGSGLSASLATLVERGCEVIICATRTSGQTVTAVDEYRGTFDLVTIDKDGRSDDNAAALIVNHVLTALE